MTFAKESPCKVNLLLNILGKRADGFHELETVMHPVAVCDELSFQQADGIELTCTNPALPTDSGNLVHRAATAFFKKSGIGGGARIHLKKNIPLAAGLGGGSGNAAATLVGLNELHGAPLSSAQLHEIAASLGSDIPFFLQSGPAIAIGRGERIQSLEPFPALLGKAFLLVHPGFGISTAWAYQTLARFPAALNGTPGRAQKLVSLLRAGDLRAAAAEFYNSLEAPALEKYPWLSVLQEFLRANGAAAALMSGSGSTTFAIVENQQAGNELAGKIRDRFGEACWIAVVPV